jgi:putative acetyltransferase
VTLNQPDPQAAVVVEPATAPTPELRALIAELDRTLARHYTPDQRHGLSLDRLFEPNVRFFLARCDGDAVGCGGVALLDGFAEVKRMYTAEAARRRGVARAVLARIEAEARQAGEPVLRLETGVHQVESIALYVSSGFRPCGAFGDYRAMPPASIAGSRFYEKPL